EVVFALKISCSLRHTCKVEFLRNMQDVAPAERRNDGAPIDGIGVSLPLRLPPGMEVRPDFLGLSNADRWRQQRIAAAPKLLGREFGARLEAYNLPPGMDACVCPACSLQIQAFLCQLSYHVGKKALNRRLAGLD